MGSDIFSVDFKEEEEEEEGGTLLAYDARTEPERTHNHTGVMGK